MHPTPFSLALLAIVLATGFTVRAEIPKPDDAPQPMTPEASREHFTVPGGFRVDLIASEPLIADPSCVAWDEKGRLFVTEIHGYNLEGHLDVTELNRTGQLDTAIRRVRVGPELKQQAIAGQRGSLKLLRDTDGDGRMDEAVVWADDIPAAYGVLAARGGLVVTASPHILFLADTDGDDRPDVREVLFTGFTPGEMERAINNPVWGPDNWIYAGRGWDGGTITGPRLAEPVTLERADFRFKPDGSAIEPVSGSNHTFGMSFDDFGNRWLITTSQHAQYALPIPYRYLTRNPHVATPDTTIGASAYHNTFPTSSPHPWRSRRGADPRWVKFYGAGEAQPNGNFTSACGQLVYRAGLFPPQYHGNHFACDPQQNMVHRSIIERDGAGVRVRRPDEQQQSEFLTSSDGWFRPNNLRTGPDGALYIVDMYREIIEDYSAIPRYLQQQYGLLNGDDRGRIWRLAPVDAPPAPITVGDVARPQNLRHPDAWWRETAQRLLVESGGAAHVDAIRAIARDSPAAFPARIHALYTLDGLGALSSEDIHAALGAADPAVRIHALRLADARLAEAPELLEPLLEVAAKDADPGVLLQAALSLGETDDPRAIDAVAGLAVRHSAIRWMNAAVLSSISRFPGKFLGVLLASDASLAPELIERAAETAARTGDRAGLPAILNAIARHPDPELRLRLLEITMAHQFAEVNDLRGLADAALRRAGSPETPEAERLTAFRMLHLASPDTAAQVLGGLLSPAGSPDFQDKAVRALMARDNSGVGADLLVRLPEATPRLAATIVEALLAHQGTTLQLLASEALDPGMFSSLQRHRLEHHDDERVRAAAKVLFGADTATTSADKPDSSLAPYYAALAQDADVARGGKLFATHCATCHQFGGSGHSTGPPLDGETGRPAESLLADVLEPGARITPGYATYLARSREGAAYAGVLVSESATSITLMQAANASATILRTDLASIEKLELSLMPDNFTDILQPDELSDIIGHLKSRPRSASLVLFDDDPGFPEILAEGRGTATLDWSDAASGRACITIDGFQRHARQVPGWNYAIREAPSGGAEFRYLRLAMKSRGAEGMMVELAADQGFPPESQPLRTYFAGKNSTGWQSNALSETVPPEWTTFTMDLWKDNGAFTLTGIALTVMGRPGSFDRIELLQELPE